MKIVHRVQVLGVFCGLVLGSFALGCAGSNGGSPIRCSPPTAAAAGRMEAPKQAAADELWIGPTRGESSDANVLAWQTDLLKAIGRDGQFCLFNYAVAADGSIFVAIDSAPLALTADQTAAASAVQAKYAKTAEARSQGKMWMAAQAGEGTGRVAGL